MSARWSPIPFGICEHMSQTQRRYVADSEALSASNRGSWIGFNSPDRSPSPLRRNACLRLVWDVYFYVNSCLWWSWCCRRHDCDVTALYCMRTKLNIYMRVCSTLVNMWLFFSLFVSAYEKYTYARTYVASTLSTALFSISTLCFLAFNKQSRKLWRYWLRVLKVVCCPPPAQPQTDKWQK